MAEDNIKDFATNWVLFGLLFICLTSFAVFFTINNNSGYTTDSYGIYDDYSSNMSSTLEDAEQDPDTVLDILSNTDPEVSDLGSKDSVASSFATVKNSKNIWQNSKPLIKYVIADDELSKILLGTVGSLVLLGLGYFIYKSIRVGA